MSYLYNIQPKSVKDRVLEEFPKLNQHNSENDDVYIRYFDDFIIDGKI